jgi:hypothetical protein
MIEDDVFDAIFGPSHAYEHNGDKALLESLGLRTHNFSREGTFLGTVQTYNGDEPESTVDVTVTSMPAQFWEFKITRFREGDPTQGKEVITVRTGSGGFTTYWPSIELIAGHMLEVDGV